MASELTLNSKLNSLKGFGKTSLATLRNLSIETIGDLLYLFPFRYEDLSNFKQVAQLEVGETVTIKAAVWSITKFKTRNGKTIVKAVVNDSSGSIDVIWFNQDYLLVILKPNLNINFSGKIGVFGKKLTLINPKYEIINPNSKAIHTERIVPVYSESAGLTKKWLRTKIFSVLNNNELKIDEVLPKETLASEKLLPSNKAFEMIHFPRDINQAQEARRRFIFEELFFLHLQNRLRKSKKQKTEQARPIKLGREDLYQFTSQLPFKLTNSQTHAIEEILKDLNKTSAMNRLLQGEVGSGKTVVACFALLAAVKSGFQAALMAPTEILAKQHFQTLNNFLGKYAKIQLVSGSSKPSKFDFDILVGTHALLSQIVTFSNLGLVIIDEQQRFGVAQRALIKEKGETVHLLTMTATPIPRTLALTIYGDLEISLIEELPSERKKVKTYLVPKAKRSSAYKFVQKQIASGGQVFVICPLIDPSESLQSVKSAKEEFEILRKEIFPKNTLALLHGKLKPSEKEMVIKDFISKKVQILVSTPVVEVGIDIPNASVMVIEAAERFGLASLHQLRGRVGRGERESYCLLFTEKSDERITQRLQILEKSSRGLEIAELDLKLRGQGNIFGTEQSGVFELNLATQASLEEIEAAKKRADQVSLTQLQGTTKEFLEKNSQVYRGFQKTN